MVVVAVGETLTSAVVGVLKSFFSESQLFLLKGRGAHCIGVGSTGEGVVTHEVEAVTCGREVSAGGGGGGTEVGVVTAAEVISFEVKKVSGVMSVDIGTNSMLLAKLDPFLFFLS